MNSYEYLNSLKKDSHIFELYESMGWNQYLKLSSTELLKAMNNSYQVIYVYDDEKIIGTGRVVSDGVINAYICGVCVDEDYRHQRIGHKIMSLLIKKCEENNLHVQLLCEAYLEDYYKKMGFDTFAIGMKLK